MLWLLLPLILLHAPARAGPPSSAGPPTQARTWEPLRVDLECESSGRVDACTWVQGFLDASELFRTVPRGKEQVRLIVGVTGDAEDDRVLLRFTSGVAGVPAAHEQVQAVNTRAAATEQRDTLELAFSRGISVYLVSLNPEAVRVALAVPEDVDREDGRTSPWGIHTWIGGAGSWTESYQDLALWMGQSVERTTDDARFELWGEGHYSASRSPSLEVGGASVSLDSDASSGHGVLLLEHHIDPRWSVGFLTRAAAEDPDGQYAVTAKAHAGVSFDWFTSDDPRGNQLSVTWLLGAEGDRYNATNQLGQDEAMFPSQLLVAAGSVRTDHASFTVDARIASQLPAPHLVDDTRELQLRRNVETLTGSLSLAVGAHVDLSLESAVTRQAIPGPAEIDASSYEAITQADYAEPLTVSSMVTLNIHWYNTNGARNNRFSGAGKLRGTDSL